MKKRAEPDGEQHDARLVARAVRCSTAWRSANDCARRSGCTSRTSSQAGQRAARAPARRTRRRRPAPTRKRAGLPAGDGRPARRQRRRRRARAPSRCRRVPASSSRSSSDGFTCRTRSSGTSENSSDTSTPIAARPAPRRSASARSAHRRAGRARRRHERRERPRRRRRPAPRRAGCRPGRARATCSR